jgi:hypothetical protein
MGKTNEEVMVRHENKEEKKVKHRRQRNRNKSQT